MPDRPAAGATSINRQPMTASPSARRRRENAPARKMPPAARNRLPPATPKAISTKVPTPLLLELWVRFARGAGEAAEAVARPTWMSARAGVPLAAPLLRPLAVTADSIATSTCGPLDRSAGKVRDWVKMPEVGAIVARTGPLRPSRWICTGFEPNSTPFNWMVLPGWAAVGLAVSPASPRHAHAEAAGTSTIAATNPKPIVHQRTLDFTSPSP